MRARLPLTLLLLLGSACRHPDQRADAASRPAVVLAPAGLPPAQVTVRVARSEAERERGLMFVEHLPPDEGMLFLMDTDRVQTFWMKDTLIPLDMIFIDRDLVVVGVVERAVPLDEAHTQSVAAPSRYVLEVNGGWSQAHGVAAGTRVRLEGVTP